MDKFASSLSEGFKEEKNIKYSMDNEDLVISKIAGIDIFQPTPENVEMFLRKYTLNEIAFFPKTVGVDIQLIPNSFNTEKINGEETVKDAQGLVILKLHGAKIELPFLIRDSEFVPFDVIQMKGQRVPYSRENMAKVLMGVDKIHNNPQMLDPNNPYLGLDRPVSEITDVGFLGDTLRIQDQAMARNGARDGEIIVHAQEFDELLEKTAKIKPLDKQDFQEIEKFLTKKYANEFIDEMEKIAEADTANIENHVALVFEELKNIGFVDVNTLPNGTKIVFPEKDGSEINLTKAIVLKEVVSPDYKHNSGDSSMFQKNMCLVVTEDGRFITLRDRARFYAIKKEENWSLPTTPIETMQEGNAYMAIVGDKAVHPFIVKRVRDEWYGNDEEKNLGLPKPFSFGCEVYPAGRHFNIAQVPGKKFEFMHKTDAAQIYTDKVRPDLLPFLSSILPYEFFAVDEGTKVIKINGTIKDYLVDPKELTFTKSDDTIFKSASADNGKVTIRLVDRERQLYDLIVEWRDTTKKIFKTEKKEFKGIAPGKVKGILRAAGLDFTKITILLERAKNDNQVSEPMPSTATPEKISGGYVEGRVQNAINKIKNNVYSKDVMETAFSEILGSQLANVAIEGGKKAVDAISLMQSFASESEALGIKFEKLAQEYNNENMLNIAKLMVAQNMIDKANVKVAKRNEKYAFVKEAAQKIIELKPILEKIAYDLIELKTLQYHNGNELISPNVIGAAVRTIDRMYKQASSVCGTTPPEECDSADKSKEDKSKEVDLAKEINTKKETVEDKVVDKEKTASELLDELFNNVEK